MFDSSMLKMFLGEDQIAAMQSAAAVFAQRAINTEQRVELIAEQQQHILNALAAIHLRLGIEGVFVFPKPQQLLNESEPANGPGSEH